MVRPSPAAPLHVFEKYQQLIHRHAPAFIRHVLDTFRQHTRSAAQAAAQLGLTPSRLYALSTAYNSARARKPSPLWTPGASGGQPGRRVAATRHRPAQKTAGLLATVSLQLRRFRSPPPARLQTRPRPSPPLGAGKPTRPCRPAQKSSGRRAPLATGSNRRTLATRRLAPPLVSSLQAFLPHAQHAG